MHVGNTTGCPILARSWLGWGSSLRPAHSVLVGAGDSPAQASKARLKITPASSQIPAAILTIVVCKSRLLISVRIVASRSHPKKNRRSQVGAPAPRRPRHSLYQVGPQIKSRGLQQSVLPFTLCPLISCFAVFLFAVLPFISPPRSPSLLAPSAHGSTPACSPP